jgi:rhodanese-related sulfurtransferase
MLSFLKNLVSGTSVGSEDIANELANGAMIIDVRTRAEYAGGHVAGSKNIPLNELPSALKQIAKDKTIVFCCASGARSGSATSIAANEGYRAFNGGPWTRVNALTRG